MHLVRKSAVLLGLALFTVLPAEAAQPSVGWYAGWQMDVVCDSQPLRVKRYISPPRDMQRVLEYLVGENIFYFEVGRENALQRMVFSRPEDARQADESDDENLLRLMVKYLTESGVINPDPVIRACLDQMEDLDIIEPEPELTYDARMRALTEAGREHTPGGRYEQLPAPLELQP